MKHIDLESKIKSMPRAGTRRGILANLPERVLAQAQAAPGSSDPLPAAFSLFTIRHSEFKIRVGRLRCRLLPLAKPHAAGHFV